MFDVTSFSEKFHFQKLSRRVITLASLTVLAACGGGGGGGGGSGDTVNPAGPNTPSTLSGTVTIAARTNIDSDINDFNAPPVSNSTFPTAQTINNLGTVQGFATAVATGRAGDNFASSIDEFDVYRVNLQAGQLIQLQVVDYSGNNNNSVFSGDLDLYLYDADLNLVDFSVLTSELEQVQAATTGDFFVVVEAFSGTSKYALQLSASRGGQSTSTDFITGEAIVAFKPSASATRAKQLSEQYNSGNGGQGEPVLFTFANAVTTRALSSASGLNIAATNPETADKVETLREIKRLNLDASVEYAEPNYRRYASAVPNDPAYAVQWHYPAIQLPQAWDITTGSGVIVAVIDTGVVADHPDLGPNLVAGFDFISDPANAADGDGIDANPSDPGDQVAGPRSSSWHGSHVAGTVAAVTNNSSGIAGVAWDARVMPLRVLGRRGGSTLDILEAVKFAAGLPNASGQVPARRADVINLSLGGGGFSQAAADVFARVAAEGVIVIAAAGNENSSVSQYPASYANVISVSAIDFVGNRAPYSSFGENVDVAAPGGDIRSDRNNDGYVDGVLSITVDESTGTPRASYKFENGTSMAAPHVAGVAALMKAVNTNLNSQSFESLLVAGQLTDEAGPAGRDNTYGFGVINALKAVQASANLGTGGGTPPPTGAIVSASPSEIVFNGADSAVVTVTNESTVATSLTGVTSDVNWATVTAVSVDGSGLGQYRVGVNRSGLGGGTYVGSITFNFTNASSLTLGISATVGAVSVDGALGPHYMILVDPQTGSTVSQVQANIANGVIPFQFSDVAAGDYYVIAGTDVDNDGFICEDGEACGAYPTVNDVEIITVSGSDVTGLGFTSDIQSPLTQFGQIQSAADGPVVEQSLRGGFALLPKGKGQ